MITEQSAQFYAKSASSHDLVYDKPERQADLAAMRSHVAEALRGHVVLELACGTGYWTSIIADSADSVVATDINPEMIALANARVLPADKVQFRVADAWNLPDDIGGYTAVFIGFWWSHVKREQQEKFLAHVRSKVGDVVLVLLDDVYVEGSSETVARTDLEGNTYHIRVAPDGERYEIPKTYPSDSALRKKLASSVREIRITRLEYYWMLTCRLK
ncbi:SAM-dependent methyltransferase [Massilia eurypsychrophila]|uniref:SAM-dependent methyltransferase n=1 Tax=Massilia eurypsychrophila TaxID=1485217 RepID=A0A2G8TF81_9BURK|nr:class I SAM-dependent methyltransferase [Massilia eurypsychrophila]PIL44705.1 SAM-dependent methyltransferase [Massilia eurypsychrophila]